DDRVGTDLDAAHEAEALLGSDGEIHLQATPLARHAGAVGQRSVHRLDEGVDVVDADAGLVGEARRQLGGGILIDVAELDHDFGELELAADCASAKWMASKASPHLCARLACVQWQPAEAGSRDHSNTSSSGRPINGRSAAISCKWSSASAR